jgi:hypothetical protein
LRKLLRERQLQKRLRSRQKGRNGRIAGVQGRRGSALAIATSHSSLASGMPAAIKSADIVQFLCKSERQRRLAEAEKLKSDLMENLFDALVWEIEKRWYWAEEAGLGPQARAAIYIGAVERLNRAVAYARQRELRL